MLYVSKSLKDVSENAVVKLKLVTFQERSTKTETTTLSDSF